MSVSLSGLSTRQQLLLMLALPVLGMIVYGGLTIRSALTDLTAARTSKTAVELAVAASHLVHEQQKERGLSAGFLSSKGEKFRSELLAQRQATDAKLELARGLARQLDERDSALAAPARAAQDKAAGLGELRQQVDALAIKPAESFARYTGMIESGVDVIGAVARTANDAGLTQEASAYLMLANAKEYAGRERATLNGAFAAGSFEPEAFRRFVGIVAGHEAYLRSFRAFAAGTVAELYDRTVRGEEVDQVARLRKLALDAAPGSSFDVVPASWFKVATVRIDLMKQVEGHLDERLNTLITAREADASQRLWWSLLLSLAAVLTALFLSGVMIGNLMRRLGGEPALAARIARAIAAGDLSQRIPTRPGDEDSVLAAMRSMQEGLRTMIGGVLTAAASVTAEAARLSRSSREVASATASSSQSAQTIAASVEQLSASIQQISIEADEVNDASRHTGEVAESSSDIVRQTAAEMRSIAEVVGQSATSVNELGQQSAQIGGMANVIREIADQTNLLALNAAIEAARAGEQGRGFAVVADEVRKLAERTRQSTLEIATTVDAIRVYMAQAEGSMTLGTTRVNQALAESDKAERSMEEIRRATETVMHNVGGITRSLHEQSLASQGITGEVMAIAGSSEQVSVTVKVMADISAHLENLAKELDQSVQRFRVA